ncbi:alpha/beta hydrolase [Streptacidiphilus carbonis]|uniref:alpha/beta hydrolase n=1 Tax=Streptacidiphilus carbonis TaxID=105422 RepID=UPI0005A95CA8|nr:alpha/beta hydrolase [Streptacidiphilus carbonis]
MNRTPIVFIHGVWLHARSWELWAERFASRGFLALAPGWPGEPADARDLRVDPGVLGGMGLDALTDHYAGIVRACEVPPVVIGHSVGGLIAQHLIGADVGRAAVAIAPAPINGIPLGTPLGLAEAGVHGPGADQVVSLSPRQFRQAVANTVGEQESELLYERYAVPAPRALLTDLGCGGAVPGTRTTADTGNTRRGPLLLISGQEDRMVPDSVTRAVYKSYGDSTAATDLKQFADRAHSLVVDSGWRNVADYVLGWLHDQGIRSRTM